MNFKDTQKYLDMPSLAYCTGYGIIADIYLKEIEYGINDYLIISFEPLGYNYTDNEYYGKTVHKLKINYDTEIPYIKLLGYRLKLDHFIKN